MQDLSLWVIKDDSEKDEIAELKEMKFSMISRLHGSHYQ